MNPTLIRLLPPAVVLTVAVWSGWPANTAWFEDQPASIARAARWKDKDLEVAQVARPTLDPFAPVLQPATQALPTVAVEEPQKAGPSPPTSAELLAYIQLEGFGSAGGQQWAVINGRPRIVGDVVLQRGQFPWACQVAQIADPHVIIRCGPAQLEVRLPQRGSRAAAPSDAASPEASAPSSGPLTTGGDAPPVIIPHPPQHDLATGATL